MQVLLQAFRVNLKSGTRLTVIDKDIIKNKFFLCTVRREPCAAIYFPCAVCHEPCAGIKIS